MTSRWRVATVELRMILRRCQPMTRRYTGSTSRNRLLVDDANEVTLWKFWYRRLRFWRSFCWVCLRTASGPIPECPSRTPDTSGGNEVDYDCRRSMLARQATRQPGNQVNADPQPDTHRVPFLPS